jgi:peptidoglycan hydrolase CwlO-like protein
MRLPKLIILPYILLTFIFSSVFLSPPANSQSSDDKLIELNHQIEEYQQKLRDLTGQKQTLTTTLNTLNAQINLTQAQISKTEKELIALANDIEALGIKIGQIDQSLGRLSEIMVVRIRETYKQSYLEPVYLIFSSDGFPDFINRIKYIKSVQNHDKNVFVAMEQIKLNYDTQKNVKEKKQIEVENLKLKLNKQKSSLASRQLEKQRLLELTKNDEKKYQAMLSQAKAELNAIQNIVAGKGDETKIGAVTEGNKIASVIPSSSACSSGAHLHFEVTKNGVNQNPANYLESASISYDYDTSRVPETISTSGSWRWPLDEPIVITQIYGATFWTKYLHYDFHTGIDMKKSGNAGASVFAVSSGTLYRGSISCAGGNLRYVRVDQGDGLSTYYLHVNYI